MKRLAVCVLLLFFAGVGFAAENLNFEEVNAVALKSWLDSADYSSNIDKDGIIICTTDKGKFLISVETKKKLVKIFRIWGKPKGVSIKILKEKANEWNEKKVFVRFAVDNDGYACADYFLVYKGGLNRVNFLESVDWLNIVSNAYAEEIANLLD